MSTSESGGEVDIQDQTDVAKKVSTPQSKAKDYLKNLRDLITSKEVHAYGRTKPDAQEEAEILSFEARSTLEKEYEAVKAFIGFMTRNPAFEDPLKDPFLEGFERKFQALVIASERAERKGYLPRMGILPNDQLEAVQREFLNDYIGINAHLTKSDDQGLSAWKLTDNPVLYHSAKAVEEIAKRHPNVSSSTITFLLLNNPMNPEAALTRLEEQASSVEEHFPLLPKSACRIIALSFPLNPLEEARKILDDKEAILNSYPQISQSMGLTIALSRRKDPIGAVRKVMETAEELKTLYPDLPEGLLRNIAYQNASDPRKAAEEVYTAYTNLVSKYPDLSPSLCLTVASRNRRDPEAAIRKVVKGAIQIGEKYPTIPHGTRLKIAIGRIDPLKAAESFMDGVAQLKLVYPNLPDGVCSKIALNNLGSPMEAARKIMEKTDRLMELFPTISQSTLLDFAIANSDPERAAQRVLDIVKTLGESHPDLSEAVRWRIAKMRPVRYGELADLLVSFAEDNKASGLSKSDLFKIALRTPSSPDRTLAFVLESKQNLLDQYPWLNSYNATTLATRYPRNPFPAVDRLIEARKELIQKLPGFPEPYRTEIAIRRPNDFETAAKDILAAAAKIKETYPDIPDNYNFNLAYHNPLQPLKAAERMVAALSDLEQEFPDLPIGYRTRLACTHPSSYKEAALKLMEGRISWQDDELELEDAGEDENIELETAEGDSE